jgi:lipopolysaccharide/colanic/teichoic acid biosynthesis glycosyltransferase
MLFLVKNPLGLLENIFAVLVGAKSWVGYSHLSESDSHRLPHIRKGVLNPGDAFRKKGIPPEAGSRLNLLYARDYRFISDLTIIFKGFRFLGRV